jgi:hypothetical protein
MKISHGPPENWTRWRDGRFRSAPDNWQKGKVQRTRNGDYFIRRHIGQEIAARDDIAFASTGLT